MICGLMLAENFIKMKVYSSVRLMSVNHPTIIKIQRVLSMRYNLLFQKDPTLPPLPVSQKLKQHSFSIFFAQINLLTDLYQTKN